MILPESSTRRHRCHTIEHQPVRRSNPNVIAVSGGPLFSTAVIAAGDPRLVLRLRSTPRLANTSERSMPSKTPLAAMAPRHRLHPLAHESQVDSCRTTTSKLSRDFLHSEVHRSRVTTDQPTDNEAAPNIDSLVTGAESHFWPATRGHRVEAEWPFDRRLHIEPTRRDEPAECSGETEDRR